MSAYVGREVLISVATDHGRDDNNVSDYRRAALTNAARLEWRNGVPL